MNRRSFLQSSGVGLAAITATSTPTLVSASRDLATHSIANALRETSPLLVYSALNEAMVNPRLDQINSAAPITLWYDWNDEDLRSVFAAFLIGTEDEPLGSIRIFDTADIAWSVHQSAPEEIVAGYIDVGGMRATRVAYDDYVFVSLRLWNVIIDAVAPDNSTDIALGIVRQLGVAIGALSSPTT